MLMGKPMVLMQTTIIWHDMMVSTSGGTPSYHPKLAIINGKTLKQMVWGTQISGNLRQGLLDRHLLRSDTGGTCERIWSGKGMSAINSGISWNSSKNIRQTNMWATCGE